MKTSDLPWMKIENIQGLEKKFYDMEYERVILNDRVNFLDQRVANLEDMQSYLVGGLCLEAAAVLVLGLKIVMG